jgi:hypothetical protein
MAVIMYNENDNMKNLSFTGVIFVSLNCSFIVSLKNQLVLYIPWYMWAISLEMKGNFCAPWSIINTQLFSHIILCNYINGRSKFIYRAEFLYKTT